MSRFVPVLVACSLLTTGCYSHVPIRPTELPKLNRSFQSSESVGADTTLVTRSVAQVEGEDGKLVELKGEHDVIVTLKDGSKTHYDHPVSVAEKDGSFFIRSANLAEAVVPLDSIQRVEVTEYNGVTTRLLVGGAGVVLSVALAAALF